MNFMKLVGTVNVRDSRNSIKNVPRVKDAKDRITVEEFRAMILQGLKRKSSIESYDVNKVDREKKAESYSL
jgi:hypothetical protein